MPTDPAPRRHQECLELSAEELLRRARPLPPRDATVIEDLTEEEAEAFFEAIRQRAWCPGRGPVVIDTDVFSAGLHGKSLIAAPAFRLGILSSPTTTLSPTVAASSWKRFPAGAQPEHSAGDVARLSAFRSTIADCSKGGTFDRKRRIAGPWFVARHRERYEL